MTARWDQLPDDAKQAAKRPRRAAMRGSWRCRACGDVIVGTWASAERHADTHGGTRLEAVIDDDGTAVR